MKTIEWRPDTCECILQLEYLNNQYVAHEQVVDSFGTIYKRKKCDRHSGLDDVQTHYNTIKTENTYKNVVSADIIELDNTSITDFAIDNNGVFTFYLPNHFTEIMKQYLEELHPNVIFVIQ